MKRYSWSSIAFILLAFWLVGFRSMNIEKNEISWDVFGYYLPLQASFIEHDPMLHQREWVEDLNNKEHFSDTLYQITAADDGSPMYFFLFGMSIMYSVFFAIGHLLAGLFGYAQDGLSPPYQYALVYGCIIYTLIGLYYFKKVMQIYFNDKIVAFLLIILVLGTNYSHHMTLKNLETVNVLFMFTSIILWNTIRWLEDHRFKNILVVGVSISLMTLIKPSEVLIILVPILWGIYSFQSIIERLKTLWKYKWQVVLTVVICLLIVLPQLLYWHSKTGEYIYDTYKNPGVGLDIYSPYILQSLFSYRKGWLLYTPVMIFALLGFVFVYKRKRELFIGLLIPFLISFYIISSWTEYWYGAGFSNRPVISLYPLLFIAFGFFLTWLIEQKSMLKYSVGGIIILCIMLNQFQWWQLRNYILDPYRTTKAYYWSTFLQTSVTSDQKKLLLIERDFSGENKFIKISDYSVSNFSNDKSLIYLSENEEYSYEHKIQYKSLTSKDHCWVQYSFDYRKTDTLPSDVLLTSVIERSNGAYGASYYPLVTEDTMWHSLSQYYLTPEIRSREDVLKYFFWNRSKTNMELRNIRINIYQKK